MNVTSAAQRLLQRLPERTGGAARVVRWLLAAVLSAAGAAGCAQDSCSMEGTGVVVEVTVDNAQFVTYATDVWVWEDVYGGWEAPGIRWGATTWAECLNPPRCSKFWAKVQDPGRVGVAVDWLGFREGESDCGAEDYPSVVVRVHEDQCVLVPISIHAWNACYRHADYEDSGS